MVDELTECGIVTHYGKECNVSWTAHLVIRKDLEAWWYFSLVTKMIRAIDGSYGLDGQAESREGYRFR